MIRKLLVNAFVAVFFATSAAASTLSLNENTALYFDSSTLYYDSSALTSPLSINNIGSDLIDVSVNNNATLSSSTQYVLLSSSNINFINNSNITNSATSYLGFLRSSGDNSFYNNGNFTTTSSMSSNSSFFTNGGMSDTGHEITNFINAQGKTIAVSGSGVSVYLDYSGTLRNLNNSGTLSSSGSFSHPISISGSATEIINNGTISSTGSSGMAILNNGTISTITNNSDAIISGSGTNNYGIKNNGTITTINNYGTITSINSVAIHNSSGTITTLNNAQGGNSNALSIDGALPTNYNILINSATSYGQLLGLSSGGGDFILTMAISGLLNFGVSNQSNITQRIYTEVLQGITSDKVGTKSGVYDGMTWNVALKSGSSNAWNLTFSGAPTSQTQTALNSLSLKIGSSFMTQSIATNFANMNTYDCNLFDKKGICLSIGAQKNNSHNPSIDTSNSVLVAGYKISPNIRIGGFLNQTFDRNSAVNSEVKISDNTPLMGLFVVWNNQSDGLGYQIKVANAYQDQNVKTTRQVFGLSEAGSGQTDLYTQSYVAELSHALAAKETIISPYFALRYVRSKQNSYTETSTVTTPLTYQAIGSEALTSLIGAKFNYPLSSKIGLIGSLGLEQDLFYRIGQLNAKSGSTNFTSENLSNNLKHRRLIASLGSYFNLTNLQKIAGEVYYQQLPFQRTNAKVVYINYTIGF